MNTFPRLQSPPSRSKKYKLLKKNPILNSSTKSMIRVPCNDKTYGFKTNSYHKYREILHDKISEEQFRDFIKRANRIIDQEIHLKQKKQNLPFFPNISTALKISLALCLVGCLILSVIVYGDVKKQIQNIILIICVLLLCISIILSGISPIFMLQSEYQEIQVDSIVKEKLDELAERENEKNKGQKEFLLWKFETDFFWIQLHINWSQWMRESHS